MRPEHPGIQHTRTLRRLWQQVFGDSDAFLDAFFAAAFAPERCLCVMDGEEAVSAVYWMDVQLAEGKAAYLYALATAQSHRGRGFAHQVLEQAHTLLRQQNYLAAILVPGDRSLAEFYDAAGYRFFGGISKFTALAEGPAAAIRKLTAEEYGALRRGYLPADAVLQEGQSLAFLERCAELYGGEDFLLAAGREGKLLNCLELLGNTAQAPHILKALGTEQGSFRTVGNEPFAMWLPLADCSLPGYFGLAFD